MEINEIRPFFSKAMNVMIQLGHDRQLTTETQDTDATMRDDWNFDFN